MHCPRACLAFPHVSPDSRVHIALQVCMDVSPSWATKPQACPDTFAEAAECSWRSTRPGRWLSRPAGTWKHPACGSRPLRGPGHPGLLGASFRASHLAYADLLSVPRFHHEHPGPWPPPPSPGPSAATLPTPRALLWSPSPHSPPTLVLSPSRPHPGPGDTPCPLPRAPCLAQREVEAW